MRKIFFSLLLLLLVVMHASAVDKIFKVNNPDMTKSPFTGMTRHHWIEADKYLLEGAFRHIRNIDTPMYFNRLGNVCYPKDSSRVRGATLEGMARTLFMASTLIREDSNVTINGIRLADYYRRQLTLLVDPVSKQFITHRGNRGPCQDLVEFGALGISLFVCGNVIWDPLPQTVRDSLYSMIESYADGPTVPQNWRFFNIFPMSFFKTRGYKVNDELMLKYLNELLSDYRGSGWYLDHPNYDYYSMWAYQLYGKLWSKMYGRKNLPEIASQFERNFDEMYNSYPYIFGRSGEMTMWGRSNIYRFAATAPLPWGKNINYGWMRRIASGCLLQFLQNPNFLYSDGVPTPGFYGTFDPVVQGYSCRGSVYWCAKAFLPLMLTDNDQYWQATENEGPWEQMDSNKVYNSYLEGPGMLVSNYPSIGCSELRAYCDYDTRPKWAELFRGSECYNRLAYNSAFPWMADGKNGEVAMNYLVKNRAGKWEPLRRYITKGYKDGKLERTVWLQSDSAYRMKLQDQPLVNGNLRIDEVTSCFASAAVRLGHYALPDKGNGIKETVMKLDRKHNAYIIDNGEYQLAMIPVEGWDKTEILTVKGQHPQADICKVINSEGIATTGKRFVTLQLFSNKGFTLKELKTNLKSAMLSKR